MAFTIAEKTLNDSEATLGCLSPSDCRSNGVRVVNELWNIVGGWVEKKRARKERQVMCRVNVDVVGDCDKTDLEVDTMSGTWVVGQPGSMVNSGVRRLKPKQPEESSTILIKPANEAELEIEGAYVRRFFPPR
jgi:hypothetical protein